MRFLLANIVILERGLVSITELARTDSTPISHATKLNKNRRRRPERKNLFACRFRNTIFSTVGFIEAGSDPVPLPVNKRRNRSHYKHGKIRLRSGNLVSSRLGNASPNVLVSVNTVMSCLVLWNLSIQECFKICLDDQQSRVKTLFARPYSTFHFLSDRHPFQN